VKVSNPEGSVISQPAVIRYLPIPAGPTFDPHPQSATRYAGESVTFSASATGDGSTSYQWLHNDQPIPGATSSEFTIARVQPTHAGSYSLQAKDDHSLAVSDLAELTVTTPAAPEFSLHPTSQYVAPGDTITLSTTVVGDPTPTLQWWHNGQAIRGANSETLALSAIDSMDLGNYHVSATNLAGRTLSRLARLRWNPDGNSLLATHALVEPAFEPGESVTIQNTLLHSSNGEALGWQVLLPEGWSLLDDDADTAIVRPQPGDELLAEWAWTSLPESPFTFSYRLQAPATAETTEIAALVEVRQEGESQLHLVRPDPLELLPADSRHTADSDRNGRISLGELLRVIEIYNTRHLTQRVGRYRSNLEQVDGFEPDAVTPPEESLPLNRYHAADTNRDARLSLSELLRVIELYNTRNGSTRTGAYHRASATIDGFAPGEESGG
jgi:hypothetical protein